MKLIGIEEHCLTPAVRDAWHAIELAALDPSVGYHAGVDIVSSQNIMRQR